MHPSISTKSVYSKKVNVDTVLTNKLLIFESKIILPTKFKPLNVSFQKLNYRRRAMLAINQFGELNVNNPIIPVDYLENNRKKIHAYKNLSFNHVHANEIHCQQINQQKFHQKSEIFLNYQNKFLRNQSNKTNFLIFADHSSDLILVFKNNFFFLKYSKFHYFVQQATITLQPNENKRQAGILLGYQKNQRPTSVQIQIYPMNYFLIQNNSNQIRTIQISYLKI